MPSWFWDDLYGLLVAALVAVVICGFGAITGGAGYLLHMSIGYAREHRWKTASVRLLYTIGVVMAVVASVAAFPSLWWVGLLAAATFVGGFFGYFLVPGEWD